MRDKQGAKIVFASGSTFFAASDGPWRRATRLLAAPMLGTVLCGCAGGAGDSARYAGASPTCPGGFGALASLVRTGRTFAFAPSDGAVVIRGKAEADGRFSGTLALKPADSKTKPLVLSAAGVTGAEEASVTYEAGPCRASLLLPRVR